VAVTMSSRSLDVRRVCSGRSGVATGWYVGGAASIPLVCAGWYPVCVSPGGSPLWSAAWGSTRFGTARGMRPERTLAGGILPPASLVASVAPPSLAPLPARRLSGRMPLAVPTGRSAALGNPGGGCGSSFPCPRRPEPGLAPSSRPTGRAPRQDANGVPTSTDSWNTRSTTDVQACSDSTSAAAHAPHIEGPRAHRHDHAKQGFTLDAQ
jgi:hypothetical protein